MEATVRKASTQFPVILITGPRQVGKTTLLQKLKDEKFNYITLDDPILRNLAKDDPALFLEKFEWPLIIDEIQYAPELLSLIKINVDKHRKPGMYWLTGSQQFQLMKGITESLAGRVAILNLLGFSSSEKLQRKTNDKPFLYNKALLTKRESNLQKRNLKEVYHSIWLGSYPTLINGTVTDRDLFYSSYLQTYLQRDIKDLTQVGNELSFLRFLKACAARTAQMLNLSELARDADISVNTAKSWLSILQGSYQIFLLQPYHTNISKRLVKRPKLYFLDTGLCSYLNDWSSPQTLESGAMSGAIFETHVVNEILKSWWHNGRQPRIYYYRDKDCKEIDLLFYQDQKLIPVEIKKSATPKKGWVNNFNTLNRLNTEIGDGCVICLCQQSIPLTENVTAIPISMI